MLTKLIKYDFKATSRLIIPVTAIVLILGFISGVLYTFSGNTQSISYYGTKISMVNIMTYVMIMISFFSLFLLSLFIFWNVVRNFWHTVFGDEGYLTHTLPVKASHILLSKLIVSNIWWLVYGAVFVLYAIGLFMFNPQLYGEFQEYMATADFSFLHDYIFVIFLYVLDIFVGANMGYLIIFLAMATGQLVNKHKKLMSVVCYIGISTVLQTVTQIAFTLFFMGGSNNIEAYGNVETVDPVQVLTVVMLAALVFLLVVACALFAGVVYIFKNKLNLE